LLHRAWQQLARQVAKRWPLAEMRRQPDEQLA
jgi:hypothetical protein